MPTPKTCPLGPGEAGGFAGEKMRNGAGRSASGSPSKSGLCHDDGKTEADFMKIEVIHETSVFAKAAHLCYNNLLY